MPTDKNKELTLAAEASQDASQDAGKSFGRGRRRSLRLHGTIARDLGVLIVSGKYQPGEILNGEIAASDRLRVSRGAYREAVRILAAKGLVESKPKVGTRVSPPERWNLLDPDVLAWISEFEPDDALISSLFELRRIIEPQAAALAAQRRSDRHLDDMADALASMSEHTLATESGRIADQKFHGALLSASGNAFLVSLSSGVGAAVSWTTKFKLRVTPTARDALPDHRRVYEAIKASDPEAAHQAMEKLVDLALLDTLNARRHKQA
jgi:DNA-binding FadR family transcriptional regulator